jgi:hypothetical protein
LDAEADELERAAAAPCQVRQEQQQQQADQTPPEKDRKP